MNLRTLPWATLAASAFLLLSSVADSRAAGCAGLSGSALSTCKQYCNKLSCPAGGSPTRCANVRARFLKVTGLCQLPCDCGNGVTSSCEQCDDGNAIDTDACTNSCTANVCGDGSVRTGVEACDDGNASNSDACKNDCTLNVCGDQVVETGVEDCDDGNESNVDACKNDCTDNVCGDNFVRTGVETCDDGNANDTDACKNDCTDNVCGDGATYGGVEDCDDGNAADDDECKSDCTFNVCGDGVVETGVEDCEDGNAASDDACKNDCTFNVCGDGVVETGVEVCDDGAIPTQNACTENCELAVLESPISEDLSNCTSSTADRFSFPVLQGETVGIDVDTVDAESASDLCFTLECDDGTFESRNDDVPCTFEAPDGSSCPSLSYVAEANATCELHVGVCAQGCFDNLIGRYLLTVTRAGADASLTFFADDD